MKKRILCFGDSNTWGYRAGDASRYDEDVRWTGRLQSMLGDGYAVVEEGHNGRTTVWDDPIENRLAGLTYLWPCMESHSPIDLLVIMVGTNDTKRYFGVEARSIAQGAGRLVDLAQKSTFGRNGQAPAILLVSPILVEDHADHAHAFGKPAAEKSRGFSAAFKAIAERYGCFFMDAASVADPSPEDGVHLNEEGHKKFAHAIYEEIKGIIGD